MRVLGVDFGSKRIGLAVGESEPQVVTPRRSIAAAGALSKDAIAIAQIARQEEAASIVVGVPFQEEQESRQATACLQLAERLRELGLAVHTADESLTSVEAERALADMGLKTAARRSKRDGEAACRILERWFDSDA